MKPSISALFSLTTLFSGVLAAIPLSNVRRTPSSNLLPNTFIVELERVSDLGGKQSAKSAHSKFYSELTNRIRDFTVRREFNRDDVFVGASITVSGTQDLAHISQIPGVKGIRPVGLVPRPKVLYELIPSSPDDPSLPDGQSTHIMTGVDKLHAEGILGDGIKIGIIDTGTDYTHPSLGGGFGEGKKVRGGHDFVGDDYNGTNTPHPDEDPLDQCNGHGTHVAGILGADPGNDYRISGVAYKSVIYSYRIFGCQGSSADDVVIEAMLRAYTDGVDVLTLSLGSADGWTEGMVSVVASRVAALGTVVTIAAGNQGEFGSWYSSAPGNGIDVISIGSVDNTIMPIQNATTSDPSHPTIPYFSATPLPINGSLPIYVTSNDTTVADDACKPLPDSTPDLSPFLVIVRRGECTFLEKLKNIAAKGAKASLIYNNAGAFSGIETGNFSSALIQADDGEFLVKQFAAKTNITLAFPQTGRSYDLPSPTGGLASNFSTYGPTFDMYFKPAVAAPGGTILSTFPVPLGRFAVLSGTSMATPFAAGCAALLMQAHGLVGAPDAAARVRTLFETTARAVPADRSGGGPLQTLTQQGAGLLDAHRAVHYTTRVAPGELLLNDTAHFAGEHTITVANTGALPERYTVRHVPAGTALTLQPGTIFPADGPVPLSTAYAGVALSRTELLIPPGGAATVRAAFTPPAGLDARTVPVYTGFIEVASGAGETLHVAYQGAAAALRDVAVLDTTDAAFGPGVVLPTLLDARGAPQAAPTNYTFARGDFPTLLFRLASGTPRLAVDLVAADAAPARRAPPSEWTPSGAAGGGAATVGPLAEFTYQVRNSDAPDEDHGGFSTLLFVNATFANDSAIPNGQYRVLLRALKITGDAADERDYERFLSPVIGVNV